ncbi:MAG: metalloregulator ArsR/SmtB family transcription factor [Treponema sp.]|jgi:ArsR family transcriptional regulator|nr:metalloregulator ArsR/SmtB family transcription factor [Treponema sp.]
MAGNKKGPRGAAAAPRASDVCETIVIHRKVVTQARRKMPAEETLLDLADLFKMFSDSTRVKILSALLVSELCVCDLAALVGMTVSAVSHQLRVLRSSKLVKFRREGKIVFYSPADDHVKTIFEQGLSHVCE